VRGFVTLGEDGFPESISEVDYIGDLDLSPFVIATVEQQEFQLKFFRPLVLAPTLDETEQLIVLVHNELAIHVFAPTRSALFEELTAQIGMLWSEYEKESPERLDSVAREVRERLMSHIQEVPHAQG